MHFESSQKHHSLEDWHGYCISLRNKLFTCKCHMFNFKTHHPVHWSYFKWQKLRFFWQKRQLQTQKQPTDPTEVFEQSSLPPRSSPGFFGKKNSNYQGSWSEPPHESKKMQKRWKCRTQLHTPSESFFAKSNWYRRTLTHHDLGQHVGQVNEFLKSACHLYYSSSFLLA